MTDPADRVATRAALLELDPQTQEQLARAITAAADEAVESIMVEVPGYAGALAGRLGQNIRGAVQLALANFLTMATRGGVSDPSVPIAQSTAAAYDLGRGEARSGRSVDALLAAYRIGARVSWRHFSEVAVACDVPAATVGRFAELVFAYIDELSAASVAGHGDEVATTGRVRERYLERLARQLLAGEDAAALEAAAEQAAWEPPRTLTAVLLPQHHVPAVLGHLGQHTLPVSGELPGLDEAENLAVLLVPDSTGPGRVRLARLLDQRRAVLGPARPWTEAHLSYERARRARSLPRTRAAVDTEARLGELVLTADPSALADLRASTLAPLDALRPAARARLEETLRAWLLHHGRREQVATYLHVHPQTVRYRMGQVREAFGDALDDPGAVLDLTIALALESPPEP